MSRRVLAMWEPWAILAVAPQISYGTPGLPAKRFETRHFVPRCPVPIRVVIHATKKWNGDFAAAIRGEPFADPLRGAGYSIEDPRRLKGERDLSCRKPLPLGCLIGVGTIVSITSSKKLRRDWQELVTDHTARAILRRELALGNYEDGRFGWELANIIELPEPIPFSGRQDVLYELDPALDAAIDAQLEQVAA